LVFAWALIIHGLGWAQTSNYAQVRALHAGQAEIDPWHWETKDKAYVNGHFYSVKAPGLAMLTLPVYDALHALGAQGLADDAAANAGASEHPHWIGHPVAPYTETGYSAKIADEAASATDRETPIVWVLGLFGAVIPALIMLLVVRSLGDRFEPGFGTAAAITLGLGTIVMSFASEYFSHVIAATFGIAAFALLVRERDGPPRPWLVAAAGLLCGLAVSFEYPLGLVGVVLFGYLVSRPGRRLVRGASYSAAALLGTLPALAFNQWALGSPFKFAYGSAVAVQGFSGHLQLGLNSDGVFGITSPKGSAVIDLLLASRGLLVLTPVLAMALAGAIALRRSHRAEANVILAVVAVYFLYNCGYWLPFGGGTPGPRFLIPALPFLALGLPTAWRRWPALTLVTAIPSAVFMVAAALTKPLIGDLGTYTWSHMLFSGDLEHTPLSALGVHQGWLAMAPVALALVATVVLAARATPRLQLGPLKFAVLAAAAWVVVALVGPGIAGDPVTPLDAAGDETIELIALSAVLALATIAVLRYRERRTPATAASVAAPVPATALGEPSS
jgi:hypothetical protein